MLFTTAPANSSFDFTSSYTINALGQTTGAQVRDGVPKNLYYTLDAAGQIVRRREARVNVTRNYGDR